MLVARQAVADRLGEVLVEAVEVALDERVAGARLVGGEQPRGRVQAEQRQRVALAGDDRRIGQRVAVQLGGRALGQLAARGAA